MPQAASSALRRVRELEREVVLLRGALADLSDEELQDTAWKDKLAQLLGKVLLFRIALGGEPESGNKEYSSRRDR
ncbi:MAG: hypothetical protein HYZ65_10730 [Burkholderiales bacterium]|nr:hypothetical protein [Burkholderiales bacterium]